MLLGKKIGNHHPLNAEMTCSKEEFKKAKEDGSLDDLLKNSVENLRIVAFSIDEDLDCVICEDSTGRLHVCSVGAFVRSSLSHYDNHLEFYSLKDVDFEVEVTEPYPDYPEKLGDIVHHPRAEELWKKIREE